MGEFINMYGEIAGSISAILALLALIFYKPIKKMVKRRKEELKETAEFRKLVMEKLDAINDDIADIQQDTLCRSHDYYMDLGWCHSSKKIQLCQMYKSYTSKGHNHLAKTYEEDIMNLPDEPR